MHHDVLCISWHELVILMREMSPQGKQLEQSGTENPECSREMEGTVFS